jgi:hypothetical protein
MNKCAKVMRAEERKDTMSLYTWKVLWKNYERWINNFSQIGRGCCWTCHENPLRVCIQWTHFLKIEIPSWLMSS